MDTVTGIIIAALLFSALATWVVVKWTFREGRIVINLALVLWHARHLSPAAAIDKVALYVAIGFSPLSAMLSSVSVWYFGKSAVLLAVMAWFALVA